MHPIVLNPVYSWLNLYLHNCGYRGPSSYMWFFKCVGGWTYKPCVVQGHLCILILDFVPVINDLQIFLLSFGCLLTLLIKSFDAEKFCFILMKSIHFFFHCLCLWCHSQEIRFQIYCHDAFALVFLFKKFYNFFTLRCLIHFQLILVYDVRPGFNSFFPVCEYLFFPAPFFEKTVFPLFAWSGLLARTVWPNMWGFIFWKRLSLVCIFVYILVSQCLDYCHFVVKFEL